MKDLFNAIIEEKLTPNQIYLLYSIRNKSVPKLINVPQETRMLTPEWLSENNTLSEKAIEFLDTVETMKPVFTSDSKPQIVEKPVSVLEKVLGVGYIEKIEKYRSCFPAGMLPSKSPARNSIPELTKKFIKFFQVFPNYGWDIILQATERYVGEYSHSNYLYMKTSSYFISKQDVDKNPVYTLASYCDLVLNGEPKEEEYYDIVIK